MLVNIISYFQGAYNDLAIYSPEMISRTLNEARMRGIRVIFEFDTPGHTNAMGKGYPCKFHKFWLIPA